MRPQCGAPRDVDPRALFEEATAVAAVSRRAGAAMARATVELLIKTLDPDAPAGANLAARIQRIKPRVSAQLGQLLDVVRVAGNGAVHAEDQPGELVVLQTANDLVDELVTRPTRTGALWDKLPGRTRRLLAEPAVSYA